MALDERQAKVRHYALLLERFTVFQIMECTGIKMESVYAELAEMTKEGLALPPPQWDFGNRFSLCTYKLTDDPEARLALSKSVEEFYEGISIPGTDQ